MKSILITGLLILSALTSTAQSRPQEELFPKVTVSGQDTLIWFTLDNVRSINVVDLSLQATARTLLYEQQKVDNLRSQVKQLRLALHHSEISYNTALELTQSKQNEIYESMAVINDLKKDLNRAERANKRAKHLTFGLGVVVVVETILLILITN